MGAVNDALKPVKTNFYSMIRNHENGWYDLEFGIPDKWIFSGNEEIECEVVKENNVGKVLKIYPKNGVDNVDDLFDFMKGLISINEEIDMKNLELENRMKLKKAEFEEEFKSHYTELDEIKATAFQSLKRKPVAENEIATITENLENETE